MLRSWKEVRRSFEEGTEKHRAVSETVSRCRRQNHGGWVACEDGPHVKMYRWATSLASRKGWARKLVLEGFHELVVSVATLSEALELKGDLNDMIMREKRWGEAEYE